MGSMTACGGPHSPSQPPQIVFVPSPGRAAGFGDDDLEFQAHRRHRLFLYLVEICVESCILLARFVVSALLRIGGSRNSAYH